MNKNKIRRLALRGGFRRVFAIFFLAGCVVPLAAKAGCTEDMVEKLVTQNLNLRLRFLRNEGLMPKYEAATKIQSAEIGKMIAERDWDGVCKGVWGIIAVADDVLAGGNGKSSPLKNPWDKCTPEKMLSLAAEYDLICQPDLRIQNCARDELQPLRRELVQLKAQAGRGDLKAERYVNRMCELYTDLLKILNK